MFRVIRVQSWPQARSIAKQLILWGFRGQSDAAWNLDTTLHRMAKLFRCPSDWLWHREYWMLRQFQRRAHEYVNNLPPYEDKLAWLALMQHYGAPTRLLDFCHSFYAAAYFAVERAAADSAVWAVNLSYLSHMVAAYCGVDTYSENIDQQNLRHIEFVNTHISLDGKKPPVSPLVVHVEPERLHERLIVQQGFFLFPCDIAKSIEAVLASMLSIPVSDFQKSAEIKWDDAVAAKTNLHELALIKIVLPQAIRKESVKDLHNMNITSTSLFPGLDGFARSMLYHMSIMPVPSNKLSVDSP